MQKLFKLLDLRMTSHIQQTECTFMQCIKKQNATQKSATWNAFAFPNHLLSFSLDCKILEGS